MKASQDVQGLFPSATGLEVAGREQRARRASGQARRVRKTHCGVVSAATEVEVSTLLAEVYYQPEMQTVAHLSMGRRL